MAERSQNYILDEELEHEVIEKLAELLREIADDLKTKALQFPCNDLSQEPDSRHCFGFFTSDYPNEVSVTFTLDKDNQPGDGHPDHWHLSIIHKDGTRVSDGVANLIVEVFFPEGGYREVRPANNHPSRHYLKNLPRG